MSKRDEAIARLRASGVLGPDEDLTMELFTELLNRFLANPPFIESKYRHKILDATEKLTYHLEYDQKEPGEI